MLPQDERVHGLSGWAPQYVDPVVVHYAKTLAQDRMPFGSDLPALTPERWEAESAEYDVPKDVNVQDHADERGYTARTRGVDSLSGRGDRAGWPGTGSNVHVGITAARRPRNREHAAVLRRATR